MPEKHQKRKRKGERNEKYCLSQMFFEIVVKDFANFIGKPLCYVAVSFNERFRS